GIGATNIYRDVEHLSYPCWFAGGKVVYNDTGGAQQLNIGDTLAFSLTLGGVTALIPYYIVAVSYSANVTTLTIAATSGGVPLGLSNEAIGAGQTWASGPPDLNVNGNQLSSALQANHDMPSS